MPFMHLNQILVFSPITHMQLSWADERDRQATGLQDAAYWKGLATTLEAARFDGIFFADTLAVPDDYVAGAKAAMEAGANFPRQDPFGIIPLMADVTRHLGFGVTLTTAGTPPFLAVRRIATLDNLSGGRIAWNVVTSHMRSDFRALGIEQPEHDDRYDRADEYMEVCYRLWDAFPQDAFLLDKERRKMVDVGRIQKVEFKGKYYSCDAYPVAMCSRQGRPLVFQAGQSGRGLKFAAEHADAIYSLHARTETMVKFMAETRAARAAAGKAGEPLVFFGVQPILGGTEAEARKRHQELADSIPLEAALSRLSGMIGIDLGKYDIDAPLEEIDTKASKGLLAATVASIDGRSPTVREAVIHWGMAVGMPQIVGSPEQVADSIEDYWRKTGCHGFNISPTVAPLSITDFAEQVVPILQRRGIMRREYEHDTYRGNLMS